MAYLNDQRFEDPYNSSMLLIIAAGIGGVVLESLISVVWVVLVARSTQKQMKNGVGDSNYAFLRKNFHQVLVEYLRAMISSAIYALFFIIPGIVRWVHLTFTCYISCMDPNYQKGEKDALKSSRELVRGKFFSLFFLLRLLALPPFFVEEIPKNSGYALTSSVFFYLGAWMISLFTAIYLALTYFALDSFKKEAR
ncbi:MAG: hypothetical protein MJK18_05590 [Bdellovibrionales bacterium]|nr:hypothetical protein [Bdellovibrionales bacterium]